MLVDNRIVEIAEKYANIVKQQYNPLKIYLYGSHTKGEDGNKSDIDVAVVFPELETDKYMEIFGNLFSIAANVDWRIEPNLFIDDGSADKYSMLYEIAATGHEI